ncbi:unnamed protein product [Brassica napus]|uniref:Phospholipase A1 n=1 Tax=Brassica napus TaxID=3708 RepID=A0A817AUL8_BRANA|nr:unnamed protein product [Brassica napus]
MNYLLRFQENKILKRKYAPGALAHYVVDNSWPLSLSFLWIKYKFRPKLVQLLELRKNMLLEKNFNQVGSLRLPCLLTFKKLSSRYLILVVAFVNLTSIFLVIRKGSSNAELIVLLDRCVSARLNRIRSNVTIQKKQGKKLKASMLGAIAKRWKVLSGQNKWKGLLDPLDPDLRRYIIHYGEMAQVGYDAFNWDRKSLYAGDCYYSKSQIFARTGYLKANPFRYNVTKYIYATASLNLPICFIVKSLSKEASRVQTNWIGYVAVATDEGKALLGRRDIVVAWRGTLQPYEWANDFDFPLESGVKVFPVFDSKIVPRIGSGWLDVYTSSDAKSPYDTTSAREQVQGELKRLLDVYKNEEVSITFTGHSLGGVMSTLAAADLVNGKKNTISAGLERKQVPITVFAFGCPRIGDQDFVKIVDSLKQLNILRIVNVPDVAPHYPLLLYAEVGQELQINTLNSTYLKRSLNFRNYHNLEIYLHGMAGMQDKAGLFKLVIGRDISLVNKGLDALKDEFLVPSTWRCLANKGMVQKDDGTWQLDVHRKDHDDD